MDLTPGFIVSIVLLDLIAVTANAFFLYVIRGRPSPYNAIDIVQFLKTSLVLAGSFACVWLEILVCQHKPCTGLKYIANDLLYHSVCAMFLAVAYIRRKVCECRGRASVLVTTRYALVTSGVFLVPVFLFNAATFSLMVTPITHRQNDTWADDVPLLLGDARVALESCRLIILNIIPLGVSMLLYGKILLVVVQTSKSMEGNPRISRSRNREPAKVIVHSVAMLLGVTFSVWVVYIVIKFCSLWLEIDEKFFVYWKTVVYIAHPFGEGLLHSAARKPVRRVRDWMTERSVRRVGPSVTPTTMYDKDSMVDSDGNASSIADQLPTLLEERDSVAPSIAKTDMSEPGSINSRTKRPSIRYTRPSMLSKNGAYIGLECRDTSTSINIYRTRKESVDRLKTKLRNVDGLAADMSSTRRLSTCLRLSSMDDLSEDEVYERYREMYCSRRGSSRYSDKSSRSRKQSDTSEFTPDYRDMSYAAANPAIRKTSDASSGMGSPSQRRWRKLYTTARSVRGFARIRSQQSLCIEEEGGKVPPGKDIPNTKEQRHDSPAVGRAVAKKDKEEEFSKKASRSSITKQELLGWFGCNRRSSDSNVEQNIKSTNNTPKTNKKRSISCVNNAWLKAREESAGKSKQRKTSVTFASDSDGYGQTGVSVTAASRSLSYDAKEYNNHQRRKERPSHTRRSHGNTRAPRVSQERGKVAHWLLEEKTTREECIEKLIEMKDYF